MAQQHHSQDSSAGRPDGARVEGSGDEGACVSVVMPSYNHAPFIEAALRSVFKQTHAPARLLVIDDGSQDGSPRVVERVLSECPFTCEMIARENRGLCATLNEGLAKTRGRYFAYLGSDDLWLPDFLAARLHTLDARARAVLAYGHAFIIDEAGQVVDCTLDWADYRDGDARRMLFEETFAPMSPTVVYRRAALERVALRFVAPHSLVKWRKRRASERASRRYGSIGPT